MLLKAIPEKSGLHIKLTQKSKLTVALSIRQPICHR